LWDTQHRFIKIHMLWIQPRRRFNMATLFNFQVSETVEVKQSGYQLESELYQHAWRPGINETQAEKLLEGSSVYTYLLRPSVIGRKFAISFVQLNGKVKHDTFTLVDPKYGIWRNGMEHHVGTLPKVIRDMMDCGFDKGAPLV